MTSIKNILLLFIFLFYSLLTINGQDELNINQSTSDDDYFEENFIRYDNFSYKREVKTVTLHPKGWPLSPPVINMNDLTPLILEFDVLDSALGDYMYTLIHCDHNWQKSDLDAQEYIMGMPSDFLSEYDYSRNTFQKYIHYSLEIPNFNMEITQSGNYILKVYNSEDENDLILTRRFCVAENMISITEDVHQPSMVNQRYSHQEIDFTIQTANYEVTNPYTDLHVVILQNHSWANTLEDLNPRFIKNNVLDYDYDGENAMLGLNEYRLLDIKNTRFTGRGIERVTFNNQENHAYLELETSRLSRVYLQQQDLNGWYFIKNDWLNTEGSVDADYVNVHFNLKQDQPIQGADVYVFGALTDWQIKKEAKLTFNQLALQYETSLYLKQGLYSYMYAVVKDGEYTPDLVTFEGTHFQTENEYAILVYHRPLGLDFDRLLTYKIIKVNSVN